MRPHPYSPELGSSDCALFPNLKISTVDKDLTKKQLVLWMNILTSLTLTNSKKIFLSHRRIVATFQLFTIWLSIFILFGIKNKSTMPWPVLIYDVKRLMHDVSFIFETTRTVCNTLFEERFSLEIQPNIISLQSLI